VARALQFGPEWQLPALLARGAYGNHVTNELTAILASAFADVSGKLLDPTLSLQSRTQLEGFRAYVADRMDEAFGRAGDAASKSLTAYAAVEAMAAAGEVDAIRLAMGLPSRLQLVAAADYSRIVGELDMFGTGFGPWWQTAGKDYARKINRAVQLGVIQGKNPRAIAAGILGSKTAPAVPSVAKNAKAFTRMTVRTAMTAVQTRASMAEYKVLPPTAFRGVRFEAITDTRTSDVCRAFDGRVYKVNDPATPLPPLHPNCRSALVPVVNMAGTNVRSVVDPGAKRAGYNGWLKEQPVGVQNALLGKTRAQLWRDGKVTLAELIGTDKRTLTLAQLRDFMARRDASPLPVPPPVKPLPVRPPRVRPQPPAAVVPPPIPTPPPAPAVRPLHTLTAQEFADKLGARLDLIDEEAAARLTELRREVNRLRFDANHARDQYYKSFGLTQDEKDQLGKAWTAALTEKNAAQARLDTVELWVKVEGRKTVTAMLREAAEGAAAADGDALRVGLDAAPFRVLKGTDASRNAKAEQARAWLADVFPMRRTESAPEVKLVSNRGRRAFYRSGEIHMSKDNGVDVYVHELGHAIERQVTGTATKFGAWVRNNRASSFTTVRLPGYDRKEQFLPGRFMHAYMGKVYPGDMFTEVLTMGLETLYRNPGKFFADDPAFLRDLLHYLRTWRTWTPPTALP
jgi:SPP1 gp7 family putative phage head morphogenesis protein